MTFMELYYLFTKFARTSRSTHLNIHDRRVVAVRDLLIAIAIRTIRCDFIPSPSRITQLQITKELCRPYNF